MRGRGPEIARPVIASPARKRWRFPAPTDVDDSVVTQAILTFWAGVLAGLILGGLAGWWKGFASGIAVGCLTIGAAGLEGDHRLDGTANRNA